MKYSNSLILEDFSSWVCPDIRAYWQLSYLRGSDQVILKAVQGNRQFHFSPPEGYALQHFIGEFTLSQVQASCCQMFPNIGCNLVEKLLQKLISLGIIAFESDDLETLPEASEPIAVSSPQIKACVQWIRHPTGYWILRNIEDVTFLQVSDRDKDIISQLGQLSPTAIAQKYNISTDDLQCLLQLLTATAMFEGTKPPKHSQRKFNPVGLLTFKFKPFNLDPWLTRHVDKLQWIWTKPFCLALCFFLTFSAVVGVNLSSEVFLTGQQLWAESGYSVIFVFVLLMMLVVSIHELGHAFTLKHYGGVVPEIGLMFVGFMPGYYTNTTDTYYLVKRRQCTLILAAGVLCQLIIWAVALWLWNLTAEGSWLHTTSYLLMVAALFSVLINLNPLSKFDGYYLAVALSGIDNLRSRSFGFYAQLLSGERIQEKKSDAWILAAYAPFSIAYTLLVFGNLLLFVLEWCLINVPAIALTAIVLGAAYFFFPTADPQTVSRLKSE